MADRVLSRAEEARLEFGPYWSIEASRSANGAPGLFFTIKTESASVKDRGIESLNREMTVYVEDGNEFLKPILEWLQSNTPTTTKKE